MCLPLPNTLSFRSFGGCAPKLATQGSLTKDSEAKFSGREGVYAAESSTWRSTVTALLILLAGGLTLALHRQLPLLSEARDRDLPLLIGWDSQSYYHMALDIRVASPFSKRALYPWLAEALAKAGQFEITTAF